jgi:proline iminopeptidase
MTDLNTSPAGIRRGTLMSGPFALDYSVEGTGRPAIVIGSSVYYPRTFSQTLRGELQLVFMDHRGFAKPAREVSRADFDLDAILDDVDVLTDPTACEHVDRKAPRPRDARGGDK